MSSSRNSLSSGLGVSSNEAIERARELLGREQFMSQSPQFGSRCFVLRSGGLSTDRVDWLCRSQSPQFGSRCFVASGGSSS